MVKRKQNDSDLSGGLTLAHTPGRVREFLCVRCGRRRRGERSGVWTTEAHGTAEVCSGCYDQLVQRRVDAAKRQGKKAVRLEERERQAAGRAEREGLTLCPVLLDEEEKAEARLRSAALGAQSTAQQQAPAGPPPSLISPAVLCGLIELHVDVDTAAHYFRRWKECVDAMEFSRSSGMFQLLSQEADSKCEESLAVVVRLADAALSKSDCWGADRAREIGRTKDVAEGLLQRHKCADGWVKQLSELSADTISQDDLLEVLSQVRSLLIFRDCSYTNAVVGAAERLLSAVGRHGADPDGGSPESKSRAQLVRFKFWQFVQSIMRTCKSQATSGFDGSLKLVMREFLQRLVEGCTKNPQISHVLTAAQLEGVQDFLK